LKDDFLPRAAEKAQKGAKKRKKGKNRQMSRAARGVDKFNIETVGDFGPR